MYIEWKSENINLRSFLLYFQELYIYSFSREYYFSKANITSATKLKEMFDEYEIDPFRYINICFNTFLDEVGKVGFRFFNSDKYKNKFVNTMLSKNTFLIPDRKSIYDRIHLDLCFILECNKDKAPEKIWVIDELINGNRLCLETLLYLIAIGFLEYDEYKDILGYFPKEKSQTQKIGLLVKRGILPYTIPEFMSNKTLCEWAKNGQKENNT